MGADRIEGRSRRIRGVGPLQSLWARPADGTDLPHSKMTVSAIDEDAHSLVELDEQGARVFLRQVLSAADVDIVGAARRVVEACRAAENGARLDQCARELMNSVNALATELAKLEGGS